MIKVEVITPERLVHTTEGDEVSIPTVDGVIGIRRGHLPLVAQLKTGEIAVKRDGVAEPEYLAVAGGFIEVLPDSVRILADAAERAEDIDELAVQEAVERARQAKEDAKDEIGLTNAAALIEMNLARLKVAQRKRSHGSRSSLPENF